MKSDLSMAAWRDSARSVKFFIFPGVSIFPLFALIVPNMGMWYLYTILFITLFFVVVTLRGYTLKVFFRVIRCLFAGNVISSRPWWDVKHD